MYSHHAPFPSTSTFPLHFGESPPDSPRGLGGHSVDPPVEEDHHHHRGKEGPNGAVEDVARVTGQDTLRGTSSHPPTGIQGHFCRGKG